MKTLIITDLTRFANGDIVCLAGIDVDSGQCVRPMPYLPTTECQRLTILPGTRLRGDFRAIAVLAPPHVEDHEYQSLQVGDAATSDEFRAALLLGIFPSVAAGFQLALGQGDKSVPAGHQIARSIVTIEVSPRALTIVEDAYQVGKLKVNFTDASGRSFRFMPLTDLGFHRHAEELLRNGNLARVNDLIHRQEVAYLRIGLSRPWAKNSSEPTRCWMQVNGIYTFPDYDAGIRSY